MGPLNPDGGGFDACLIPVLVVQDGIGQAVALRPAGIHPVEHLGPVLSLSTAGPGLQGDDGRVVVVLAAEQGLQPGALHILEQGLIALLHLSHEGFVFFFVAHLAQHHQIIPASQALFLSVDLVLQLADALLDFLCLIHIVPEAVGGGLGVKHIQLPFRRIQIQSPAQLL